MNEHTQKTTQPIEDANEGKDKNKNKNKKKPFWKKGPLAWMAGNSVAANLLMLLLMVGGLLMAPRIKQEEPAAPRQHVLDRARHLRLRPVSDLLPGKFAGAVPFLPASHCPAVSNRHPLIALISSSCSVLSISATSCKTNYHCYIKGK